MKHYIKITVLVTILILLNTLIGCGIPKEEIYEIDEKVNDNQTNYLLRPPIKFISFNILDANE